jgi:ABC-type dipeptide/oligopeptide/nickel transport system permease component
VSTLLWESLPTTTLLMLFAVVPVLVGSMLSAGGWLPKKNFYLGFIPTPTTIIAALGLVPAVILALVCAAIVQINYGALSHEGWPWLLRLLFGGLVLAIADGALSGAIAGTRSVVDEEIKQRYVQIAVMRGEGVLSNTLPNVLPALIGQLRGRILNLLSGAVIVEVVLQISGLGELLWDGTLLQDFGVVLAAAWAFSLLSGALLLIQAVAEIAVALHVRRYPRGVLAEVTT